MSHQDNYYEYVQGSFAKWAPFYNLFELFTSGLRPKVVKFADIKNGSKVLDVCTGTGEQAFAFAKKGYDVFGIDLSKDMLMVAHKNNKYPNVAFNCVDATKTTFEDDYFDCSCISFGLHEMPPNIREKVVREILRVTKPGGIIIVIDYDLPKNKFMKAVTFHVIKLYESKYYPEFIKVDVSLLLKNLGIQIDKQQSVICGIGRMIRGIKLH